jgi:hypothetical protein
MRLLALRRPHFFIAAFVFGSMLVQHEASRAQGPAKEKLKQVSEYDRPAKMRHQSRSATVASHGIVAASVPLAAQIGLDILKAGGTAADAAIATDAMLGLTEPMSCGMGGTSFAFIGTTRRRSCLASMPAAVVRTPTIARFSRRKG